MEQSDIILFLKTEYQRQLEKADYLFNKEAPEEQPYIHKYEQRKILQELLKNENFQDIKNKLSENELDELHKKRDETLNNEALYSEKEISQESQDALIHQYLIASKMIAYIKLGANFSETEEGSLSEPYFEKSLTLMQQLDKSIAFNYYNYLIETYNIIGLTQMNRDQDTQGLQYLGKAIELYNCIVISQIPEYSIYNNSGNVSDSENDQFKYYYEGGLSFKKTESLHTHSLFYLAQAYTKVGQKELAAKYCGLTMKRQFESKTHTFKDFCVNCMSLAEFYGNQKNFQQAEYLLLSALSQVPEGKKKKMRASLEMSLGFLLHQYMSTSVDIIELEEIGDPELPNTFNREILRYKGVDINLKTVTVAKNTEDVKSIFRQANTQFKKALNYFLLDGFVTEHIQIVEHQAELYQFLVRLEEEPKKLIGLLERKVELLEPIFKQLNPKSYQATYEKLLCTIAESYNAMLETKYKETYVTQNTPPKPKALLKINQYGYKVIELYDQIHQILMEDKETERNQQFYNSLISAKFNQAKALTKIYVEGKEQRVNVLVRSLKAYEWIEQYIRNEVPQSIKDEHHEFDQQQNMCLEMIQMLPSKIDKCNNEQWA